MPEQRRLMPAIRTAEHAHVLNQPQNRNQRLLEHPHPPPRIDQRDVLRRAHDHRPAQAHPLHHRQLRIPSPRRHVHHQHVQRPPLHLTHHLLQRPHHHRPPPDHRRVRVHQKPDRHHLQPPGLQRDHPTVPHVRLGRNPQHPRQARPMDVRIQQPHPMPLLRQRHRDVHRRRALPNPPLARGDRHDMPNLRQQLRPLRRRRPARHRRCSLHPMRRQHHRRIRHPGLPRQHRLRRRTHRLHRRRLAPLRPQRQVHQPPAHLETIDQRPDLPTPRNRHAPQPRNQGSTQSVARQCRHRL